MRAKLTPIFVSHDLGAGFLSDVPSAEQRRLRLDAHQHIAAAVIAARCLQPSAHGSPRSDQTAGHQALTGKAQASGVVETPLPPLLRAMGESW